MLYGTTPYGGSEQCSGEPCGTVFSLTPPSTPGGAWTYTTIYSFTGGSDGAAASGPLAIGSGGVLYGTTNSGGIDCGVCGAVFSLTPPASPGGTWTKTVIHSFAGGPSGWGPEGVVIGRGGALYGLTYGGGTSGLQGTVFAVLPPASPGGAWVARMLHSFKGYPTDGSTPSSLAIGSGGVLYGTTNSGGIDCGVCGAVFSLTPPASPGGAWTEAVIYTFRSWNDSFRTVVMGRGGVLYGTSSLGGSGTNSACQVDQCGTIFSLSPPASPGGAWTEAVLHNFAGPPSPSDGDNPQSSLVLGKDGVLFGTTNGGGASNAGIVFAFRP